MPILHKADIHPAAPLNTFRFSSLRRVPAPSILGDVFQGMQPVLPQDSPYTVPFLSPTWLDLAAVEKYNSEEALPDGPVGVEVSTAKHFYSTGLHKLRNVKGCNKGAPTRAYTPDTTRMASEAQRQHEAVIQEAVAEHQEKLDKAYAVHQAACVEAKARGEPEPEFRLEMEEAEPEVAAAPPTVRADRAVIRLGQLQAYLNHSRCLLFMFFRHFLFLLVPLLLFCFFIAMCLPGIVGLTSRTILIYILPWLCHDHTFARRCRRLDMRPLSPRIRGPICFEPRGAAA